MKTYLFRVTVEPDDGKWVAICPVLEERGAATWGNSREEALKNIQEVLQLTLQSMTEHGEAFPSESADVVTFAEPRIAVTL